MSLLKQWTEHCHALEKAREQIEQLSKLLPASGSGRRVQTAVEKAWRAVTASSEEIDELITSAVQPLPVKFPWQDKDFTKEWTRYKEYLQEQHGINMKSRMEQARLNAILKFSGEDRQVFINTLNFYMALGSPGIFQVNFESPTKPQEDGNQPKKVTIKLS